MPNLYDVYPFTTGELREFSVMTRLPDEADIRKFADAALNFLDSPAADTAILPTSPTHIRHRGIWLPEGMVDISEFSVVTDSGNTIPLGFDVDLTIAYAPRRMEKARSIIISQVYSGGSGEKGCVGPRPELMDYGIREHQRGDDSQDVLNTLIALRHGDTVPDHLDMLKGSLTEDPRVAEFKAVAEGLMLELLVTGEFSQLPPQAPAVEPKITLASQDTITKLTDLLVSVNS